MVTIIVIGAVTALAMFAVLMKVFAGEPADSENLQKGDIIKQLLALSELENPKAKTAPQRPRAPSPGTTSQPAKPSPSKSSASNEPKPSPPKQPKPSQSNEPKSSSSKQVENASECVGL